MSFYFQGPTNLNFLRSTCEFIIVFEKQQTAALHGNELNGIPLTHRLVLQEIQCKALHGIVVAVPVANVPGYLAQQRGFSDGTDLNRLMPG